MLQKKSESSFAQVKSKIKVVFLGEQSTGKTSILVRFIHDRFEEGVGPTIGIDFMAKNLQIGANILRMQLWDTAGQERFRSLIPSYLKDALIAFIVFDLTNAKSFDNLNQWIDLCHNNKKEKATVILLGNKEDLRQEREVTQEQVRLKLEETNLPYFQVSAKTGTNIKEAFNFAGNQYFNQHLNSFELTFTTIIGEKSKREIIHEDLLESFDTGKKENPQLASNFKKKKQTPIEQQKAPKEQIKLSSNAKKDKPKKKGCC